MKKIDPISRACSAYVALTVPQQVEFRMWMRGYEAGTGHLILEPEHRRAGRPPGSRNKPKDAPAEGSATA